MSTSQDRGSLPEAQETGPKKKSRRAPLPGESQAAYEARLEKIRRDNAAYQKRHRDKQKQSQQNTTGSPPSLTHETDVMHVAERKNSVRNEPQSDGSDGTQKALDIAESCADSGVGNIRASTESDQSYSPVRFLPGAGVFPPSVGGGETQTPAEGLRKTPSDDQPTAVEPCDDTDVGQREQERTARIYKLFPAGRHADDEYQRQLLSRFFAAEDSLRCLTEEFRRFRDEVLDVLRAQRGAIAALAVRTADAVPDASAARSQNAVDSEQDAAPEPASWAPSRPDRDTMRGLVAIWKIAWSVASNHQAAPTLQPLEVLALERVWAQAMEAAHGEQKRARDLYFVWIDRFLKDPSIPASDRTPDGLFVRSHGFVRRLSPGLCETWPPFADGDVDDYEPFCVFENNIAIWEEMNGPLALPEVDSIADEE